MLFCLVFRFCVAFVGCFVAFRFVAVFVSFRCFVGLLCLLLCGFLVVSVCYIVLLFRSHVSCGLAKCLHLQVTQVPPSRSNVIIQGLQGRFVLLILVVEVWQELLVRGEGLVVLQEVSQSQGPIHGL